MSDVQTETIVTLAEMRQFLNITDSADTTMDNAIIGLLDDLCADIADELGLDQLINKSYTETYDGDGTKYLFLDHKPIVAVTTLQIDDIDVGTENTDYFVYLKEGYIELYGDTFEADNKNVDVVYTAGYGVARANVTRKLKLALKLWVSAIYKGEVVDYSSRFEEGAYVSQSGKPIPDNVNRILNRFRKVEFGSV